MFSVQDLINKWEKYVQEHQLYEHRMADFKEWMGLAGQRLAQCTQPVADQESLEEKRAMIQVNNAVAKCMLLVKIVIYIYIWNKNSSLYKKIKKGTLAIVLIQSEKSAYT